VHPFEAFNRGRRRRRCTSYRTCGSATPGRGADPDGRAIIRRPAGASFVSLSTTTPPPSRLQHSRALSLGSRHLYGRPTANAVHV